MLFCIFYTTDVEIVFILILYLMLVICSHVCVEQVVKYVIVKIIDMFLLLATVILVQSLYDYIATIFSLLCTAYCSVLKYLVCLFCC